MASGWFDNFRRLWGWRSSVPTAPVITDAVVHVAEFSVPTVALFRPFPTCAEFSVPTVATFRQQVTTVAAFNAPSL